MGSNPAGRASFSDGYGHRFFNAKNPETHWFPGLILLLNGAALNDLRHRFGRFAFARTAAGGINLLPFGVLFLNGAALNNLCHRLGRFAFARFAVEGFALAVRRVISERRSAE